MILRSDKLSEIASSWKLRKLWIIVFWWAFIFAMITHMTKWGCHPFFYALVLIPYPLQCMQLRFMLPNFLNVILFPLLGNQDSYQSEKFRRGYRFLEAELQDRDRVKSGRYAMIFSCSLKLMQMDFLFTNLLNDCIVITLASNVNLERLDKYSINQLKSLIMVKIIIVCSRVLLELMQKNSYYHKNENTRYVSCYLLKASQMNMLRACICMIS